VQIRGGTYTSNGISHDGQFPAFRRENQQAALNQIPAPRIKLKDALVPKIEMKKVPPATQRTQRARFCALSAEGCHIDLRIQDPDHRAGTGLGDVQVELADQLPRSSILPVLRRTDFCEELRLGIWESRTPRVGHMSWVLNGAVRARRMNLV
jgi:hypothetical protein